MKDLILIFIIISIFPPIAALLYYGVSLVFHNNIIAWVIFAALCTALCYLCGYLMEKIEHYKRW